MDVESGSTLSSSELLSIKDVVVRLAREVGEWAKERHDLHHSGASEFSVDVKSVPGDVVTEVDVESQRRIVERLSAEYPSFRLLGEEGLSQVSGGGPIWVIDPIDGTHNFVRGYPSFCVSIGLVDGGESVLGVIYDVGQDAVYWAVRGQGAWREGQRVRLTPRPLANALISTNFTAASSGNLGHRDFFVEVAHGSAGVRASGSACRDFCFVADGRVDLFWQFGLRAWDVAAGLVLVREAGGATHFLNGTEGWMEGGPLDLLVGAPSLLEEVLEVGLPHLDGAP